MLHVMDGALRFLPRSIWNYKAVLPYVQQARRFILTDESSAELGTILRETESLMLQQHQFALPPYPVTYLEINTRTLYAAFGRRIDTSSGVAQDDRVGYLIANNRIWVFAITIKGEYSVGPFIFHKDSGTDMVLPPVLGTQEWTKLYVLLGTGIHSIPDEVTRQALLRTWTIERTFTQLEYNATVIRSATGEIRNIMAVLLLLNQPKVFNIVAVPRTTGLYKGHRTVFLQHSVVQIKLGQAARYRRALLSSIPVARVRHEVRGHFVHSGTYNKECIHEWPAEPGVAPRSGAPTWTCGRCGGKRTWRADHVRGSSEKGFNTKEYELH